ncbi:MAG: hypothetical protein EHM23_17085 [Acidobacteria bacterium]|nr:MAG: hypothetical protein EHM23_17085 [Acidobacteriota bacterium]
MGDDLVKQAAREAEELLDECIGSSRSLTSELSPPILHEGGLIAGLEWLARWMADKHGIFVELDAQPDASPAAEDVKALLFESVRELLFNAVKHSGAKSVLVSLRRLKDDLVHLVVSDTGRGFDPKALKLGGISGGGFGLFSIRERLELIGGHIEIDSAPGEGSRFAITAPMGKPAVSEPQALSAEAQALDGHAVHVASSIEGAKIRVMLADDHVVMREGLALLLGAEPDVEIVGEAADVLRPSNWRVRCTPT